MTDQKLSFSPLSSLACGKRRLTDDALARSQKWAENCSKQAWNERNSRGLPWKGVGERPFTQAQLPNYQAEKQQLYVSDKSLRVSVQPTVKRYYLLSRNSFDQSPSPFPSLFTCAVPKWPWSFPFFFFLLQILLPVLVKCSVKGVENRKKLRRHRMRQTCNSLSFSVEKPSNFGDQKWNF